jgi:hypothetical protein
MLDEVHRMLPNKAVLCVLIELRRVLHVDVSRTQILRS